MIQLHAQLLRDAKGYMQWLPHWIPGPGYTNVQSPIELAQDN